jgi:Flp pilus assembly protein TadG
MAEQERKAAKRRGANGTLSEQGQDLVEFALILPLLLLLLLGIIEFGLAVFHYNSIANVGREVARFGSVHPSDGDLEEFIFTDPTTYTEHIRRWTRGLIVDTETLSITYALNDPGEILSSTLSSTVQVTVTYKHEFLTGPVILVLGENSTIDLRAVSTMYTERQIED